MHRTAVFGLFSGIVLVVVTLIGVAMIDPPQAEISPVQQGALVPCPLAEVQLDQGYGVARKALRAVCASGMSRSSAAR